jgi:hypothetical protein
MSFTSSQPPRPTQPSTRSYAFGTGTRFPRIDRIKVYDFNSRVAIEASWRTISSLHQISTISVELAPIVYRLTSIYKMPTVPISRGEIPLSTHPWHLLWGFFWKQPNSECHFAGQYHLSSESSCYLTPDFLVSRPQWDYRPEVNNRRSSGHSSVRLSTSWTHQNFGCLPTCQHKEEKSVLGSEQTEHLSRLGNSLVYF